MKVTDLKTEYLNKPLGLGCMHPRLFWNDPEIRKQKQFELSFEVNGNTLPPVTVESDAMHYDVPFDLHSRDRVTWGVRVLDEAGNWSEKATSYFEMGLLIPEDFEAKWISGNYHAKKGARYPADCFRKMFELREVKRARLYASACGIYEIKINGKKVSDDVMAPGFTDYRKRIQYQTYDVTSLLKEGQNVLTAVLCDGWYRGSIGAKGRTNTYGDETRLYIQLEVFDEKENKTSILSDGSFDWSNDGPVRFADLKDGEIYDFNHTPSYAGKAKKTGFSANLSASDNFAVKEMEVLQPQKVFTSKTGKRIYELPCNIAGYISVSLQGKQGQQVKFVMGEMLDENNDVTLKNIQCIHKGKKSPLQEVHLTLKDGINDYHSGFWFGGFRYISVEADEDVSVESLCGIALYSSFEEEADFHCSHELINTFYQNALRSLKGNSLDIPTDCPTRERMGWTGDSQVFFHTASYLVNYAPFARKHIRDLFDRQWKNGKLAQIVPYSNEDWFMWPMNGSIGWADAGVLIPWRYYEKYGDDRLLREHLDGILRYGHFMESRIGKWGGPYAKPLPLNREQKRYAVNCGQSYGEWAEPKDVKAFIWTDFASPHPEESTAYTAWILQLVAKIAKMYGREAEAKEFDATSSKVKEAYQELVKTKEFSLDTDRQAKLVRPLYMNLLTKSQETYAKKRLVEALEHYGWRLGTGFLSTPFILNVLQKIDTSYAYRLLENEEMPGWLYMAKHSTGTIWEGWEGLNSDAGIASLNHYSKGAMVEWLFTEMCGIHMDGENHFVIAPLPGGTLTEASASYHSIYGTVQSSWEIKENEIIYKIHIPGNTTAKVQLASEEPFEVSAGEHEYRRGR